jgi:hypothetical protein
MAIDSRDRQRDAGDKPGQHATNTCPIHGVEFVVARGEATRDVVDAPFKPKRLRALWLFLVRRANRIQFASPGWITDASSSPSTCRNLCFQGLPDRRDHLIHKPARRAFGAS